MTNSILDRLQTQRTMLADVLRQMDVAIAAFGGSTPHSNGNGKRVHWTKTASPERLAAVTAKIWKARRKRERAERRAAFKAQAEAAARTREGSMIPDASLDA